MGAAERHFGKCSESLTAVEIEDAIEGNRV